MPIQPTTSFNKMRTAFFFALIIVLAIAMLYVFRPFFFSIFWAAIIAILFYPAYRWINKQIKMPSMSSFICVILVIVVLVLPLVTLTMLVVNESFGLYQSVTQRNFLGDVENAASWVEKTPLAPYVKTIRSDWTTYASNATKSISIFLFNNLKNLTQLSLRFAFMLFIMLYTLYYFFKDGPRMLKRLMYLSPLGDKYEEMLYEKFTSTARATLKGTLIVGGIQGLLGGILFWITGVEGALVWGVIMVALSIIPAIGSFIVWLPAGIIMLAIGNTWQGIMILVVGALVISTIDNLLRPPLVGNDIQMHPLIVLFATLGGLIIFGISGFVIGPVLAALFISSMSIYSHYFKTELKKN